jgi:hypothetical protein
MEATMDNLTLNGFAMNLAVYAAMIVGGFVLGTIFGRSIAAEFALALARIEARLAAIEAAFTSHPKSTMTATTAMTAAPAAPAPEATKGH